MPISPDIGQIKKKSDILGSFFLDYFFGEDDFAKPLDKIFGNGFLDMIEKRCERAIT